MHLFGHHFLVMHLQTVIYEDINQTTSELIECPSPSLQRLWGLYFMYVTHTPVL